MISSPSWFASQGCVRNTCKCNLWTITNIIVQAFHQETFQFISIHSDFTWMARTVSADIKTWKIGAISWQKYCQTHNYVIVFISTAAAGRVIVLFCSLVIRCKDGSHEWTGCYPAQDVLKELYSHFTPKVQLNYVAVCYSVDGNSCIQSSRACLRSKADDFTAVPSESYHTPDRNSKQKVKCFAYHVTLYAFYECPTWRKGWCDSHHVTFIIL